MSLKDGEQSPGGVCHAGEQDKGGWEWAGQEVSPGPIKCVCLVRRVYGSRGGRRLGQVLSVGC